MIDIAELEGWTIAAQPWPEYSDDGNRVWWRVHVRFNQGRGRYGMKWNGHRFARESEFYRLEDQFPVVLKRVTTVLQNALPNHRAAY